MRRVAALVPHGKGTSPGQRTRTDMWADRLGAHGWSLDLHPFEDRRLREVFGEPGKHLAKALRISSCYVKHLRRVLDLHEPDAILVYREAALIGPAVLERLAMRTGVPLVYDLDDPIFVRYRSPTNGWLSVLKCPGKARSLFRMADHVIVHNNRMAEYASDYNSSVTVVPLVVDTDHYRPAKTPVTGPLRLVWIGSRSTMPNLASIGPALRRLQSERSMSLQVIGTGEAVLPGVQTDNRRWSLATEVDDIQACTVGLVPVADHPWNRWKFFFKTVQYMAAGLPVVARRIGANVDIIEDGVNGFLVESQDEWYDRLRILDDDPRLREGMGAAARQTAVSWYSIDAQLPRVAALFDAVAGSGPGQSVRRSLGWTLRDKHPAAV